MRRFVGNAAVEAQMRIRTFALSLAFALVLAAGTANAQSSKVPRIGYLIDRSGPGLFEQAFLAGMHEHGYIVGENIAIEYRWSGGKSERLPQLAADLVAAKVDLIVTQGAAATLAAKRATATIPIVMASSQNAVGDGLVASLARPGGNVTGRSVYAPELTPKRIELLKEAVPSLSRVGVLWNARNPAGPAQLHEAEAAGRVLDIAIDSLEVRIPDDLDTAMARAASSGAGAVLILSDSATISHRSQIAAAAQRNRLPTMFANKAYLEGGGMMSYGPDIADSFRLTAMYVDKILKGARPGDLPVEQPTRFELAVNLKAARALGLQIRPLLLARADEVIE
jgi:putative tryptophan/tyrosine transport system substrate-binding protein